MNRATAGERLPIAVWLAVDEQLVDKSEFTAEQLEALDDRLVAYRRPIADAQEQAARLLAERYDTEPDYVLSGAPVLFCRLEPGSIRELADDDLVAGIFLHEPEGIEDLTQSMAISNADDVVNVQGWRGTNLRVAVWENAADDLTNLQIQEHFDPARPNVSTHARLVTGIIRNREPNLPNGYAPDALIFAANSMDVAALEWAVTQRACRVVNQSFHRQSEAANGTLSFDDLLKDYLAVHAPYPTIVQAAGNFFAGDSDNIQPPSAEFVNHKGFNSISIANHNDTATAMSGSSDFRNPTSSHSDRELPELSANGTGVTAVGVTDNGTSFASPAVAGAVALLQNMDNTLISWPEGNRSILLAGARLNPSGGTWIADLRAGIDGSDGAGALDVDESGAIARTRRFRNASATRRGWDVGTLGPTDFDPTGWSTFSYQVAVPVHGGRHVKVALAWNSEVSLFEFLGIRIFTSTLTLDFDLHVLDSGGNQVASSASWDNSYEIAEFNGQPGATYTIRIRRWSGQGSSWYGLAWTVV
jgi:hypothetical protein